MIKISKKILLLFILSSIIIGLYGCEVEFTPDIPPLILGTLPPDQPFEDVSGQANEFTLPTEGDSEVVPGFTSTMAIALCKEELLWGDEILGMCLAPNGQYYFYWMVSDEVNLIQINTQDPNQAGFRNAAQERKNKLDGAWRDAKNSIPRVGGMFLSMAGIPFACGTVFLCLLDAAAIVTTAGLVVNSGESIVNNLTDAEDAERKAIYYSCRLQGEGDLACRDKAGIEQP